MTLRSRILHTLTTLAVTLAFSNTQALSQPEKVRVKKSNISQFEQLTKAKPWYTCYRSGETLAYFGTINKRKLKTGVLWKTYDLSRLTSRANVINLKMLKLENKGKQKSRKYKKLKKQYRRLTKKYNKGHTFQQKCTITDDDKEDDDDDQEEEEEQKELSGNPASLEQYREKLTKAEIRHLLDKVAFGGTHELEQIGREQGLSALVDVLVDGVKDPQYTSQLESDAMYWASRSWHYPEEGSEPAAYVGLRIWTTEAVILGQTYRLLYSRNPFHEYMLLMLSSHYAVNLQSIGFSFDVFKHYGLKKHWDLLVKHATGNIGSFTKALYKDPAMNFWLDNKDNHAGKPNENYSRELMELFLLGAVDPLTGSPNYDEESIGAATAFASGHYLDVGIDPVNQKYIADINFAPILHDNSNLTLFRGIPEAQITSTLSPEGLIEHILYNHPGSPRYLAERFAGQMLYPGLPDNMINTLASTLKNNRYELKPFLKQILKSSAMFAPDTQHSCISSPLENIVKLSRKLIRSPLPRTGEKGEIAGYVLYAIAAEAGISGQILFQPPSVFGWKGSCNVNRNGSISYGEGWLSMQHLLNRSRACVKFMEFLNWYKLDFISALGLNQAMTAEDIVTRTANLVYNQKLSEAELKLLARFITEFHLDGKAPIIWGPELTDDYYVRSKIPRLICLIGDTLEANRR